MPEVKKGVRVGNITLSDLSDDQIIVFEEAGKMVRKVLTVLEVAFNPGVQTISAVQIEKLKKICEEYMYEYRNTILKELTIEKESR